MNEDREHCAIGSKYMGGHAFGAQISSQLVLANTFFKKQECCNETDHSTEQSKQPDYVLALFKHCKGAETTVQIGMNSNHKAVIARIELPIDHKTRQTERAATSKATRPRTVL